jgi:hypothetical protein
MDHHDLDDLEKLKKSIGFKKYILSLDVPSRAIVLDRCIEIMMKSSDPMKNQCITWLQNIKTINENNDVQNRKKQIRLDGCWEELHTELIKSGVFSFFIIQVFGCT